MKTILLNIVLSIIVNCTIILAQNEAFLIQSSGFISEANIVQTNGNNVLEGPDLFLGQNVVDQNGSLRSAALQLTSVGDNRLDVFQEGSLGQNKIELLQIAFKDNTVDFTQSDGSHTLKLYESSLIGKNESHIQQENGTGYISLVRYAGNNNIIPSASENQLDNSSNLPGIYQNGSGNYIVGSYPTGFSDQPSQFDMNLPAVQTAIFGSNWLEIHQVGNDNIVGMFQMSGTGNVALINQTNDDNTIAAVQTSIFGSNFLHVEQYGNSTLYINQKSVSGINSAIVIQN